MRGRVAPVAALLLAACASTDEGLQPRVGLAPHALPNLGLMGTLDWRLEEEMSGDVRLELAFIQQFLDDEDLADDGNQEAGDWTQVNLDLRFVRTPEAEASWEFFGGPVWFQARGAPNLVEVPGRYVGVVVGAGYQVHLSPRVTMGPELSLVYASTENDVVLFPQFSWGVKVRR